MDSRSQWNSIEDIFESSLNLEETHLKEGYEEGYKHGIVEGKDEAREVGLKVGFEVGEEIGFYRGCVDIFKSAIQVDPNAFSARIQKNISQMEDLLEKYPLLEPEDENVQEIMDSLRLKFRIIRAGLGMNLDYDGYPKPNEVEF